MDKINRKIERLEEEAAKGYPVGRGEESARRHEKKQKVVKSFLEEVRDLKKIVEYSALNGVTTKFVTLEKIENLEKDTDFATVEMVGNFVKAINVLNFCDGEILYVYIAPFNVIYKLI